MDIRRNDPGTWMWFNKAVIDIYGKALGPYGLAVYMALGRYANNTTQQCWPSKGRLAHDTGMSVRSVRNALKRLEELELIHIVEGGGGRYTSTYTLRLLPSGERPFYADDALPAHLRPSCRADGASKQDSEKDLLDKT